MVPSFCEPMQWRTSVRHLLSQIPFYHFTLFADKLFDEQERPLQSSQSEHRL